jgi:hypothetical protein
LLACNFVAKNLKGNAQLAALVRPGLTFNVTLEDHEVAALEAEHNAARAVD